MYVLVFLDIAGMFNDLICCVYYRSIQADMNSGKATEIAPMI